jgi:hypothetical protein
MPGVRAAALTGVFLCASVACTPELVPESAVCELVCHCVDGSEISAGECYESWEADSPGYCASAASECEHACAESGGLVVACNDLTPYQRTFTTSPSQRCPATDPDGWVCDPVSGCSVAPPSREVPDWTVLLLLLGLRRRGARGA